MPLNINSMYAYIKGEITVKTPTHIVLETGGIGYHIHISLNTFSSIEKISATRLWIYQHVKEDSLALYGFHTEEEKSLFILLISVSGIGPNTARIVLSSMKVNEVESIIINEDVAAFKRIKGIGPKTAQRIIIDLKDKLIKKGGDYTLTGISANSSFKQEAISALLALGFSRQQVQKLINDITLGQPQISTAEQLVKMVLKKLS